MSLFVGIDAGGTKLAAALVDPDDGRVVERALLGTRRERGGDAVLADCVELARQVAGGHTVQAIGIGVPELVSPDGRIESAVNWDWRDGTWKHALDAIAATYVESDVRAAALAEARLGAGRGLSSFLYVTVGTGISHAFVIAGTPWSGARGNAIITGSPPVEEVASGSALARTAGMAAAEDVLAAPSADPIVEAAARELGNELARLVNAFDPEAVVVGGGLGLEPAFRERFAARMRPKIYAESSRSVAVVPSTLRADAGVVGAALHAAERAAPPRGSG